MNIIAHITQGVAIYNILYSMITKPKIVFVIINVEFMITFD